MRATQAALVNRVTLLALFAIAGNAQAQTLKVHQASDKVTLDWTKSTSEVDLPLVLNLQEGLTTLSKDLKTLPQMAESWSYDETGTKIDFLLRKNIFWSDGKPVRAQDFLAGFKQLLNRTLKLTTAYLLFDVRGAQEYFDGRYSDFAQVGIQATSDQVLRIQLKETNWQWIERTSMVPLFPIREDLLQSKGTAWTLPGNLVNNGPFTLVSHTQDSEYVLKPNLYYKLEKTGFKEIRFLVCSFEAAVEKARLGAIDLVFNLPYKFQKDFDKIPNFRVSQNPPSRIRKIDFNLTRYPTSMVEVRRALAGSIDKADLTKTLDSRWIPATSWALPWMPNYRKDGGIPFKLIEARSRFRNVFPATQKRIEFTILVANFDESKGEQVDIANYLKNKWEAALGIQVKLLVADSQQQYLVLRDTGEYNMLLRDQAIEMADPLGLYESYATGSRFGMKWQDSKFDDAVKQMHSIKELKLRLEKFKVLDDFLLVDQVAALPLFYKGSLTAASTSLQNVERDRWRNYSLKKITRY